MTGIAMLSLGLATGWAPTAPVPSLTNIVSPGTNYVLDQWSTNGYRVYRTVHAVNGTVKKGLRWDAGAPVDVELLYGSATLGPGTLEPLADGFVCARFRFVSGGRLEAQSLSYYATASPNYTNVLSVLESYRPGTFAEHIWTSIVAAVGAQTNDATTRKVYVSLPTCYSNVPVSTNSWLYKTCTNWTFWALGKSNPLWSTTCSQVWYQGSAKLITPRHWITTGHMQPPVGEQHYWVGPNGETATRTTIAVTNGWYSGVADMAVCLLDADVPDWVKPAPLVGFNAGVEIQKGAPVIWWLQSKWCGFGGPTPGSAAAAFSMVSATPGDSGSPIGFVADGRFIMSGYGGFNPSLAGLWITNLNAENGVPQVYEIEVLTTNWLVSRFAP